MRTALPASRRAASRRAASWPTCLAVAAILAPSPLPAATLNWINPAGGAAGFSGNWNPAQVPGPTDYLVFALPDIYAVSFGGSVPLLDTITLQDGYLAFDFVSNLNTIDGEFMIGAGSVQDATLWIRSGSPTFHGRTLVGFNGGSGVLTIDGASPTWSGSGSLVLVGGYSGATGVMEILDGTTAIMEGLTVGRDGFGTLTVEGRSALAPFSRSTLTAGFGLSHVIVGTQQGAGTLEVLGGALLDCQTNLYVGIDGAQGTLLVSGATGDTSTAHVSGGLYVGGPSGGTGVVIVDDEATLDVDGATETYDPQGFNGGTLEVRDGGIFTTHDLHLAEAEDLALAGGEVRVIGGTLDLSQANANALEIDATSPDGARLTMDGGASGHLRSTTGPTLRVADGGQGFVTLRGSELSIHDQNAVIGDGAGSSGIIRLESGSTLTVDEYLIVGREGFGILDVKSGSQAWMRELRVATQSGGVGGVTVDLDAAVHVGDRFAMAGTPSGPAGRGATALVSGDLWLDGPGTSGNVWRNGFVELTGGAIHLAGALHLEGALELVDGTSIGGSLRPAGFGSIEGQGDLRSRIVSSPDTTTQIVAAGTLLLGRPDAAQGFEMHGVLDVGAHEVTVRDADSAMVATVLIDGGILRFPDEPAVLETGHNLRGKGTVHGGLRLRGRAIADGDGIAFGGTVYGTGQGMSGSTFRFLSGAEFIGEGNVEATVQVDAGATITATNPLGLGETGKPTTVTINGLLDVGPHIVACYVADTTRVEGVVDLNGGFLLGPANVPTLIRPAGTLRGNGTIGGPLRVAGTISPGHSAGRLQPFALKLDPSARLEIELGDHAIAEWDTVSVVTLADLGGTLDLRTLPTFNESLTDTFLVLTALDRNGTFASVTVNGMPAGGMVDVVYSSTGVHVITHGVTTGAASPLATPPARTTLSQNFPNPFNPETSIEYALAEAGKVELRIFDLKGRMVRELVNTTQVADRHRVTWNGRDGNGRRLGSGVYLYRLDAAGFRETRRMVMAK